MTMIDIRMLSIPQITPDCSTSSLPEQVGVVLEEPRKKVVWSREVIWGYGVHYNVPWVGFSMVLELIIWPRINRKHTGVSASNQLPGTTRVFSKGRLER